MKCCSAQIASCWDEPEKTLKKAKRFIEQAASRGARIVCFPEQFATGWHPRSKNHIEDISGPIVSTLRTYAREYSIAILGSFRARHHPLPKNSAVAIAADGSIRAVYAKMHPFAPAHEDMSYAAGDDIALFDINGMKFGIAICYDLRFPPLFHLYALQGADGVFVPAAWPASRINHWKLIIRARALENQMYVIGINTTGKTPVDRYSGFSMVADPEGTVIARAGDGEELLDFELSRDRIDHVRRDFPILKDYRIELYRSLQQGS